MKDNPFWQWLGVIGSGTGCGLIVHHFWFGLILNAVSVGLLAGIITKLRQSNGR